MKRFRSNLVCGVLKLMGVSKAKIVLFHKGSTELQRCENCIFVLLVNIITGVTRRLLGPHDTLPCVLISLLTTVDSLQLMIYHLTIPLASSSDREVHWNTILVGVAVVDVKSVGAILGGSAVKII